MKTSPRPQRAHRHWQAGQQAAAARQWGLAAREFGLAAQLTPGDALVWLNGARAWLRLGELDKATRSARRAFELQPDNALACRILAECLVQQHRFDEAVQAFEALAPQVPRDHDLLAAHGNALFQARRLPQAVEIFFCALAQRIDSPLVHYRMGLCFKDMGMAREASECFRTAITLDEGTVRALALSLLVHESRQACDWSQLESDTEALLAALDCTDDRVGEMLSPFALLAIDSTPAQQRRIGELRTRGLTRGVRPLAPVRPRAPGPVRVGYLSADFSQHATAVLMAELLERRDAQRFEVFLYSHSVEDGSDIQRRVRAAADHYLDVTHLSNEAVARRMREDRIDIAIDLKGHTRDSRFEILAWRPAALQVAFLGYPGSTGAEFIDYLIGDPVVTPLAHAAHYSECIAQMPHSYQPNDSRRPLPPAPQRSQVGLPDDAVVLCCFNQTYKMSPTMLDLWARILHDAPRAVLWMLAWNPHAELRLRDALARRGIDRARVLFAPKRSLEGHLARLQCADLFLDTWPCNAHTTASEALWAGVPVLTVPGRTFASRVAASLVSACGLAELACADEEAYVRRAVALANDPAALERVRAPLRERRRALPLFDAARYARDFEALLLRMHARAEAGEPPQALPAGGD
jgi:predicted O-linked N-acetylglucosamine transferase (SPINDLY family)